MLIPGSAVSGPIEERCYACGRKLAKGKDPRLVVTADGSWVYVGPECARRVSASGASGWQPPRGGPRLYADP